MKGGSVWTISFNMSFDGVDLLVSFSTFKDGWWAALFELWLKGRFDLLCSLGWPSVASECGFIKLCCECVMWWVGVPTVPVIEFV